VLNNFYSKESLLSQPTSTGNIVLTGASGSGKSTIGRQLSKLIGLGFVDLDDLIEASVGKKINQIFQQEGEEAFRAEEIRMLSAIQNIRGHVVAVGGGALLSEECQHIARKIGPIVWVQSSPVEVARRIYKKIDEIEKRPSFADLLGEERGDVRLRVIQERVRTLLDERRSWYSKADVVLDGSYVTPDMAAQHLKDILQTEGFITPYHHPSASARGGGF
jgi:shikimate kinase